ncbi:hypothetical protein CLAIMM_09120 [Cladophialophora immunda]|nr:hypothetical protein CLAIMM_09120 [Cladophialophora immunda]
MLAENGNFGEMFWNDKKKKKNDGSDQSGWSMDNNPASVVDHADTPETGEHGTPGTPLVQVERKGQDAKAPSPAISKGKNTNT